MCFYIPTKPEKIELLVGSQFFHFLKYLVDGPMDKQPTKFLNFTTIIQTFVNSEGIIIKLSTCTQGTLRESVLIPTYC